MSNLISATTSMVDQQENLIKGEISGVTQDAGAGDILEATHNISNATNAASLAVKAQTTMDQIAGKVANS